MATARSPDRRHWSLVKSIHIWIVLSALGKPLRYGELTINWRNKRSLDSEKEKGLWVFFDSPDADADVVPVGVSSASAQSNCVSGGACPSQLGWHVTLPHELQSRRSFSSFLLHNSHSPVSLFKVSTSFLLPDKINRWLLFNIEHETVRVGA